MPHIVTSRHTVTYAVAGFLLLGFASQVVRAQSAVEAAYARHCAACHGAEGRGDGPAAYLLYPKPRDFTAGVFRFKSTPGDARPLAGDLARTIRAGVPRTAMPGFEGTLDEAQIESLAAYLLGLGPAEVDGPGPDPMAIPPQPELTPALAAAGRKLYVAAGCKACHGPEGRGDGPSADSLKDNNGFPIPAADFTTGIFKSGRRPVDVYRSLMVGVPGTPMPGFAGALGQLKAEGVGDEVDRGWAIVAYLENLSGRRPTPGKPAGATVTARPAAAAGMLEDPNHAAWSTIEPTRVAISPLWQRGDFASYLDLRAVRHDSRISVMLEWPDRTASTGTASMDRFTDGVGIMFSLTGEPLGLSMGGEPAQGPAPARINIWHWRADRQMDVLAGERRDGVSAASGDPSDLYPLQSGKTDRGTLAEHDTTYLPARAVGNERMAPALADRPALESNAAGFSTLTLQPADQQSLTARGAWAHGVWRVVISRAIETGEGDVSLEPANVPMAVAVWEGHARDRNGTKLVSGWHWLRTETESKEESQQP